MFFLFASTSDVEQMGLQLSLESVQSHLLVSIEQSEDCSTELVLRQRSSAGRSWFGLWELKQGIDKARLTVYCWQTCCTYDYLVAVYH